MTGLLLLHFLMLARFTESAPPIFVKNMEELVQANKNAKPGDMIVLRNGEWKDVEINLDAQGTKENLITYKAETPGKVIITGHSQLKLGGRFLVVDGFYFTRGYSGDEAVFSYRVNKDKLANDCRITNCVINDFNNPRRMDENNWVAFYGKNNRLDHCSFIDKKNMGVLLAVILDDERSRENYHSIDHNYFGRRIPLASNGGEIIRVGVSQHCQFNSNTHISRNFFEYCDGETEIISMKSGNNVVDENIFKESQGSVVLRHGDNNFVTSNIFLGNDKPSTGGVRVINKGQRVGDNIFYKCRGVDFRSPMAIMNGIPNSPAHRYVQVTEADIAYNTFYECSPLSFGEGSDAERTLPPEKLVFANNKFYNTRDSVIYLTYDKIDGFRFANNVVTPNVRQELVKGFEKTNSSQQKAYKYGDPPAPEYLRVEMLPLLERERYQASGAGWFPKKSNTAPVKPVLVQCATTDEVYKQLETKTPVIIRLTARNYLLTKPFTITKPVEFTGNQLVPVKISTTGDMMSAIVIAGDGNLSLQNLSFDGAGVKASHFISSDSSGSSSHYSLSVRNCSIMNLNRANGCQDIFYAYRYMVADSLSFRGNSFTGNKCNGIMLTEEKEDKGYYNAEKIFIGHNVISNQEGELLNIYRGGSDESTLGPQLVFSHNRLSHCQTGNSMPLIRFTGVQLTSVFSNSFTDCNAGGILITYKDTVRARHLLEKNVLRRSGKIEKNNFVREKDNR